MIGAPLWLRGALNAAACATLDTLAPGEGRPGARLATDGLSAVAEALRGIAPNARIVRCLSFTKDGDSNWGVGWHQDRIIAARERQEVPGYRNWSLKSGVWHCEPPLEVLERMLFVRVHLDESDAANGAMEIAAGSHAEGLVPSPEADVVAGRYPGEVCVAGRGDILVLPMLTLHRSLPARDPRPRRTLRIDMADFDLPAPLAWAEAA